jgi:AbrB family looped-hinge helix DNA binding protein
LEEVAPKRGLRYFGPMNAQVKLTPEGHIVIPPDVRKRLAWAPGATLDIVEFGGAVTLRKTAAAGKGSFAKALKKLRETVDYDGPVLNDADWKVAIDAKFRESDAI